MQNVLQHPLFIPLVVTLLCVFCFPLVAGYLSLVERKLLADFQVRLGPMRVGPNGILQPIADAVKLLTKEDVIPTLADQWIFWVAPIISTMTALCAFTVLPFSRDYHVADVNVGLLVISAMSAVGILGVILGGWSSNSHYSLLGSLRGGAQLISYEVALSLALLSGVMAAGTLSMVQIVERQQQRGVWFAFDNFGLMIVPFVVYFISSVAETNRAPFDLPEAESELVAGYMTEYSGFRWALYFLAEYANMVVVSSVAVTLFLGGWLRPFPSVSWLDVPLNYGFPVLVVSGVGAACLLLLKRQPSRPQRYFMAVIALCLILCGLVFLVPVINQALAPVFWFLFKVTLFVYTIIWIRATFPRFRYDQLMNIGWKYMIPIGLGAILVNAIVGMLRAR
jgi:NADH-quinone oxidoreductase subunit H